MEDEKKLQEEFIQFLVKKSGAKSQKELETFLSKLKEEELNSLYQEFYETKTKNQKVKAMHGAKLNYIKRLKNLCEEDEELVYLKKGGRVDCKCRKKITSEEEGGKVCPKCGKVHKAGMGCIMNTKKYDIGGPLTKGIQFITSNVVPVMKAAVIQPARFKKTIIKKQPVIERQPRMFTVNGKKSNFNTVSPDATILNRYFPNNLKVNETQLRDRNGNTIYRTILTSPSYDPDTTYYEESIPLVVNNKYSGDLYNRAKEWFDYLYKNRNSTTVKPDNYYTE